MASKWLQDRLKSLKARWLGPSAHTGNSGYEANLKRIRELHCLAEQVAEHRRLLGVREKMGRLFPRLADESIATSTKRWERMLGYAVANADAGLADILGKLLDPADPLTAYRAWRDCR